MTPLSETKTAPCFTATSLCKTDENGQSILSVERYWDVDGVTIRTPEGSPRVAAGNNPRTAAPKMIESPGWGGRVCAADATHITSWSTLSPLRGLAASWF